MKFHLVLKEFVRPIISNKVVNTIVLATLRHLHPLLPNNSLVRIPVNGIARCKLPNAKTLSLYAEADDPTVSGLMFRGMDAYEVETMDVFRMLANNSKLVYDVGANTGIYTMIAAVENPSCAIHAFEPVPRIYQRLKINMLLNKVSNVQLNQSVVSNHQGTTSLYIPAGRMPTSSSTAKGHRKLHEEIEASTITLDIYSQEQNVSRVDLIKIDTESTEPKVLEGAIKLFESCLPTVICEVLNTTTGGALKVILDGFGYRYFWITKEMLIEKREIEGDPKYIYLNYLFIHPSKMDDISTLKYKSL